MTNKDLADLIFPNITKTIKDYEEIYPKRNFFIVSPENVSIKPFGKIIELLGAIPVPGDKDATKNFLDVIEKRIQKKQSYSDSLFHKKYFQ